MKKALTLSLILIILSGCTSKLRSIKSDQDTHLDGGEGYLLMAINTNRTLERLFVTGSQNFSLSNNDVRAGTNYILINLPAGKYEFSRAEFWSLYIDIPSIEHDWTFEIESDSISYVGDLELESVGGRRTYVELVNNSSVALEFMEERFPNILKSRTIKYKGPGTDDFYQLVALKAAGKGTEKGDNAAQQQITNEGVSQ